MIWGGSFSGKSHTLAYIKFLVQQTHGYKEDDIIELTVGAGIKNEFVKFHAQIMDGITHDKLKHLLAMSTWNPMLKVVV